MQSNARKAAWRFDAMWAVPARLVGSTALTDRKCLLEELDSLLKRDLVEHPTFPAHTSYVKLKLKSINTFCFVLPTHHPARYQVTFLNFDDLS
jgi:hypothetical protein